MANYPLAFGELLAGAILLDKGVAAFRSGLASGGSSSSTGGVSPSPAGDGLGTVSGGGTSHGLVTVAALDAVGKTHGWAGQQITDWMRIIILESDGTLTDTNPSSGAYGIAQFINGPGEYAVYGGNATTLAGQLTAMANYISSRYGNPSAALAFHLQNGWY